MNHRAEEEEEAAPPTAAAVPPIDLTMLESPVKAGKAKGAGMGGAAALSGGEDGEGEEEEEGDVERAMEELPTVEGEELGGGVVGVCGAGAMRALMKLSCVAP